MNKSLEKARNWLYEKSNHTGGFPVYAESEGKVRLACYLYKLQINGQTVWYCMDTIGNFPYHKITRIRRICI